MDDDQRAGRQSDAPDQAQGDDVSPKQELQFADAIHRSLALVKILKDKLPGSRVAPLPDIKDITKPQWETFKALVLAGVTPHVAAQQAFFCSAQKFAKWMREGASALDGSLVGEFHNAVKAVASTARAIAEARMYYDDPHVWLLRGPAGRTLPDEPGWTDEKPTIAVQIGVTEATLMDIAESRRSAAVQSGDEEDEETQ